MTKIKDLDLHEMRYLVNGLIEVLKTSTTSPQSKHAIRKIVKAVIPNEDKPRLAEFIGISETSLEAILTDYVFETK